MDPNTIYDVFKNQAEKSPEHLAVLEERRAVTYGELNRLTDEIISRFPKKASVIGIMMDHSTAMIAAILAVLKSGAAYVPVEPDFPIERSRFMLKESGTEFVLTQKEYARRLEGFPQVWVPADLAAKAETPRFESTASPEKLAYVLYTSGSTGVPKGVLVENRNVCHYVRAFQHEFHPSFQDVMLQYSVCSFDIFVEEVFTTLLSGATLAIPPAKAKKDITELMAFVGKNNVTIISGFPYLLMEMNELPSIPSSLRLLISGGDVLRHRYVSRLLDKADVYNTYGPSETTVCASYFRCNGSEPLSDETYPIGKPVAGADIMVMDENGVPVKEGQPGELWITGDGVSRGYVDPEKNAAFLWENGRHIYKSGDLGILQKDGNLAFLRRKDTQVMILGKRVEPGEVENVLCRLDEVKAGVVYPRTDEQGLSYLTAYVVPAGDTFHLSKVKEKMSHYLTPFMIPEFFVLLDHIPLTANGKLNPSALPIVLKEGG